MEQLAIEGGKPVRDNMLTYGRQTIDEHDVQAVSETLRSDYLTTGPKVDEFETKIARYVGATYAVAFNSGTSALHGAVFAAGIGPGDEVITTPMSFAATANCLLYLGATPVFIDISKQTLNLSYKKVLTFIQRNYVWTKDALINRFTQRTLKGIIPVHFAGHPVNLERFARLASRYNLTLIEDGAHAFEASHYAQGKWHKVGSCRYSDMTMFSFHPVKHITTGEGGIITTNNRHLYNRLILLRAHGITRNPDLLLHNPGPWHYEMQALGYNYRMSDLNAALGISQLKKSHDFLKRRIKLVSHYLYELANVDLVRLPQEKKWARSSWHILVIRLNLTKLTATRDEIFQALRAENIGVNVHYIPIYKHPWYAQTRPFILGPMTTTEQVFKQVLTLPLHPGMTDQDCDDVINALTKVLNHYRIQPRRLPTKS